MVFRRGSGTWPTRGYSFFRCTVWHNFLRKRKPLNSSQSPLYIFFFCPVWCCPLICLAIRWVSFNLLNFYRFTATSSSLIGKGVATWPHTLIPSTPFWSGSKYFCYYNLDWQVCGGRPLKYNDGIVPHRVAKSFSFTLSIHFFFYF